MSEPSEPTEGYVDVYGFSPAAGGWILGGWISRSWDDTDQERTALLQFDTWPVSGAACICVYDRPDVQKIGLGFAALLRSEDSRPTYLTDAIFTAGGRDFRLVAAERARALDEAKLLDICRELISAAPRGKNRAELMRAFSRSRYAGRDTLADLALPVFLELDTIYICPPHGLLLRGWFADPYGQVRKIRLRSAASSHPVDPAQWIRIPRPDVAQSLGERVGTVDPACGFLVYLSPLPDPGAECHFELELASGELAFKRVAAAVKVGLAAIREILGAIELRYEDLARGFDVVAGPAIASLNHQRLRARPAIGRLQFGTPPPAPRASLVIPLYGRMDFLEFQMAFFYQTLAPDHELIYVLDDPACLREVEALAASSHARFGHPLTVLTLSHNVGYAPANNIGLAHARAPFVCFLNSDVFPQTPDWLETMLVTAALPGIGIVGARLLFEDDTIQHDGIEFAPIPAFAGWQFALHPHKGRQPAGQDSIADVPAATGACLVMATATARTLGGFDEGFVIGDFEDADLCKRVLATGQRCVVDRRARLYHLERQSQGDQADRGRINITLFNAWLFNRKWAA